MWGTAGAGAGVTVEFSGQSKITTSGEDGQWMVRLDPLESDAVGSGMTVRSGDEKIEVSDLLVGEVWYASGQSNMEMNVASCAKKIEFVREVLTEPKSRLIRTMRLGNPDTAKELEELPGAVAWQVDTPKNRAGQSAAAYFYARELHDELEVPVGIIEGSWGGKPIEGFIPRAQFEKSPGLKTILELSEANELGKLAKMEGGVVIRNTAGRPGRIFNARVAPVAPYAVKGFLWYQGESNAGTGEDPRNYREKMRALVEGWRSAWKQDDLPFYFVQLPSYNDSASGWVRLREEQRLSLEIPKTGMAVTIDLKDSDIHPSNKVDVGKRLASWALAKDYGKSVPYSGPLFQSIEVEGRQITVNFEHVGDGLMVAQKEGLGAPVASKEMPLAHFEIADEAGHWHAAKATIEGAAVVVQSEAVSAPVAVRYACEGDPENANLYNRAGFPASPFCSKLEFLPWGD
ncbi:sialate O-acetylesterase [Verrucomicrobiaceae bacterium 227]